MEHKLVVELNDGNFQAEILDNPLPALVDFWGPSCGPCKALVPVIEQLASSYEGRVKFGKVNVDNCFQTALQYAVKSLPTILLFKNGKVLEQFMGRPTPQALDAFVQKAL